MRRTHPRRATVCSSSPGKFLHTSSVSPHSGLLGRPIASSPGSHIDVMERKSPGNNCTMTVTGKTKRCINVGSYNYLGFADDWKETCAESVLDALEQWPVARAILAWI